MKYIIFLVSFLFAAQVHSQSENDTIRMKEIVIDPSRPEGKMVKIKTTGEELGSDLLQDTSEEVSLITGIPEGYLQSVTFYFNSGLMNLAKKAMKIDYKDTPLALVIYEAADDGTPGKVLCDKEIRFTVKKEHKGALELDVSRLNIRSRDKLFIGLATVTDIAGGQDVVVKVMNNFNAVTWGKPKGRSTWENVINLLQIKMKLVVQKDAK
jgi:hypothetical protein